MLYKTLSEARQAIIGACLLCLFAVCFSGCALLPDDSASSSRQSASQVISEFSHPQSEDTDAPSLPQAMLDELIRTAAAHMPQARGTVILGNEAAQIDASNTSKGYVMVRYTGTNHKVKLQLTKSGSTTYTYDLSLDGQYQTFPLSDGDGTYTVNVFENIADNRYSQAYGATVEVIMDDPLLPFLGPNQYVNYTPDNDAAMLSYALCAGTKQDLEKISLIYNYVIENIAYDYDEAKTVESGYLPDVDEVLETGKGICFDYAALMTAMMRVLGIPTRLAVGYAGSVYHAWICVYTEQTGWINGMIRFDGQSWELMDPTFAASADEISSIMEFIGDGANYNEMYSY